MRRSKTSYFERRCAEVATSKRATWDSTHTMVTAPRGKRWRHGGGHILELEPNDAGVFDEYSYMGLLSAMKESLMNCTTPRCEICETTPPPSPPQFERLF